MPPAPRLRSRRIYILPTRACWPLVAVLLAMAWAAVGHGNSVAYLLGFFLASLAVVSMVHTHFALTRLRVHVAGRIAPVFAGQPARVPLALENPTSRARTALEIWQGRALWRWPAALRWRRRRNNSSAVAPAAAPPVFLPQAPGQARTACELLLPTGHRGEFPLGRLAVSTIYPLGFFRGWFYEETAATAVCLVYPAPAPAGTRPLPEPLPPRPLEPVLAETAAHPAGAAGDDYAGTRPYLSGDSQRRVDWRAAARGQGLLVKQFIGADENEWEIVWLDWRALAGSDDDERRLSQLCRWALEAEARPDGRLLYGLRLPAAADPAGRQEAEIAPGRGEAHLHRCLRALAFFGEETPPAADEGRR